MTPAGTRVATSGSEPISMSRPPSLDIIIVSFNARADLGACLESLDRHPPAVPHAVVVIDNASSDGSAGWVAARWPHVRLIAQAENIGFARANNVGLRATRGDLVLLLNSDTVVPAAALDALIQALSGEPRAAAAGPRLVDDTGVPELSFGRMITPWNEAGQKTVQALQRRGFRPARRLVERRTRQRRFVDWVSGAALLVWRRDAEAAGLIDERYFMYAEDVDFCAALRALGRGILFVPEAEIVHRRGRSRAAAPGATTEAYRRSQLAFYAKHNPHWLPWLRWYLRVKGALPR
jgi:N-acetylglucosaminyl-diphospho-decaprenol L-rhamnosyltransferase